MRQIRRGLLLVVGASALAACASHSPVNSAVTPSTGGSAPVAGIAAPDMAKRPAPAGYKRVVRRGKEYFCRTQEITGSHTMKTEVCLTQDELDAKRAQSGAIGLNTPAPGQNSPR